MKPGATTRPSASIVRDAASRSLPIATIFPLVTATSPRKAGRPEPSMMRPFLIRRSYAIMCSSLRSMVGQWVSGRDVWRGKLPRFDVGPHLRQGLQGREERLDFLRRVEPEQGLHGLQGEPEPGLAQEGLQALGRTVNLGQQNELGLVYIRQLEGPRNGRTLLRRPGPLPPLDERDLVRPNSAVGARHNIGLCQGQRRPDEPQRLAAIVCRGQQV